MEVIATLPPVYRREAFKTVCEHPGVSGVRYNVGARSPYSPKRTLEIILDKLNGKDFWIDLKGRQLRITKWAVPTFGDIELNHNFTVDLPAKIIFRGGEESEIRAISGNKVFIDPPPSQALGAGQAVNVHGTNLKIEGYLTEEDKEYIIAAKELGIHNYMASFVEDREDIREIYNIDERARVGWKIESEKGIKFATKYDQDNRRDDRPFLSLIIARDDLFINIKDKLKIMEVVKKLKKISFRPIVASRILTSFQKGPNVSMGDLADLQVIKDLGFQRLMLSDGLCADIEAFNNAMKTIERFFWIPEALR